MATLSRFNFVNPIVRRWTVLVVLKAPRWEYTLVVVGFRYTPESKKLRIFRSRCSKTGLCPESRDHEMLFHKFR